MILVNSQRMTSVKESLKEMVKDELVVFERNTMKITNKGHAFLRNACMALDERLKEKRPDAKVFSKIL